MIDAKSGMMTIFGKGVDMKQNPVYASLCLVMVLKKAYAIDISVKEQNKKSVHFGYLLPKDHRAPLSNVHDLNHQGFEFLGNDLNEYRMDQEVEFGSCSSTTFRYGIVTDDEGGAESLFNGCSVYTRLTKLTEFNGLFAEQGDKLVLLGESESQRTVTLEGTLEKKFDEPVVVNLFRAATAKEEKEEINSTISSRIGSVQFHSVSDVLLPSVQRNDSTLVPSGH